MHQVQAWARSPGHERRSMRIVQSGCGGESLDRNPGGKNKQRSLGEEVQRASLCSDRQPGGGVSPIQIEGRWEEECAAPIDELKIVWSRAEG